MAKSIWDQLADQMSGGAMTPEAEAAARQARAYAEQMQREKLMSSVGGQGQLSPAEYSTLANAMYRPEGAYQSPNNTMTNVSPYVGGLSAQNTQAPIDINTLLRYLGYR